MIKLPSYILLLFLFLFLFHTTDGQERPAVQVTGHTSAHAVVHNGELPPFWQTARQEGRYNHWGANQILGVVAAGLTGQISGSFFYMAKAELNYNNPGDNLTLHTGWAGIQWRQLVLKGGRHLFNPIFPSTYSGSGSYLFGDNFKPVPRITFGIQDYVGLPFTNNRLEIRGGISQGWLNDDRKPHGNSHVLLHEKYGYLRWNGGKWKPYIGLNHSSLFGGTYLNKNEGKVKIPIDFLATFFAQGSSKIGGGEETNAAGAHMGLYDFGLLLNTRKGPLHIYYQIPFSDGSGMYFFHDNTDHIAGINWQLTGSKWLSNLTVEWIQTTHQSGNGMPDPGAIVEGKYISISRIMNQLPTSEFMLENFGIEKANWTVGEVKQVLKEQVNHGNEFAGRDGYMSNGLYPAGWTYEGQVMGNPLNLTVQQLNASKAGPTVGNRNTIVNDRYSALHAGAQGHLTPRLNWKAMITWSRNFGSYYAQYPGRYSWDETENYYFKGGRTQWYTLLGFIWRPPMARRIHINGSFAFDAGQIYNSAGLMAGLTWFLF